MISASGVHETTKRERVAELAIDNDGAARFTPLRLIELDGLPIVDGRVLADPVRGSSVDDWTGGFAFAVQDRERGTVHAYRDQYGARPLYHATERGRLLLSSELPALLGRLEAAPAIDEVAVVEYLATGALSEDRTFHRGVKRVPAASRLTAAGGRVAVERYWRPWLGAPRRSFSRAGLTDEFRRLFGRAVDATLHDDPSAGVLLSGGPDSSAVLAMAAGVARRRGAGSSASLEALTMIFEQVGTCDESVAARRTASLHGVPWRPVAVEAFSPFYRLDAFLERYGEPPCTVNLALEMLLLEAARETGITVLLDGHDADALFTPSGDYLADLFRRLRWLRLAREVLALRRLHDLSLARLLRFSLAPLVPAALKRRRSSVPVWINPDAARATDLEVRLRPVRRGACFAQTEAERAVGPRVGMALEATRCLERMHGIEGRHPFFDPSLVRFLLSIPLEERFSRGETKILLRRSLSDLMTAAAGRRIRKTSYTAYFDWSLRKHLGAEIRRLAERGSRHLDPYVDWRGARPILVSMLETPEGGVVSPRVRLAVWRMLVLERWLESKEGLINRRRSA